MTSSRALGLLAMCAALALAGCEKLPTRAGSMNVALKIQFPDESCPDCAASRAPARALFAFIDSIQVTAYEVADRTLVARVQRGIRIGEADSTFQISLDLPVGPSYRIGVEALGIQVREDRSTLPGLQFYGERDLGPVVADGSPVVVQMVDVVPRPIVFSGQFGNIMVWNPVPFASGYTVSDLESERGVADTTITFPYKTPIMGHVRADLYNGLHSGYSEFAVFVSGFGSNYLPPRPRP